MAYTPEGDKIENLMTDEEVERMFLHKEWRHVEEQANGRSNDGFLRWDIKMSENEWVDYSKAYIDLDLTISNPAWTEVNTKVAWRDGIDALIDSVVLQLNSVPVTMQWTRGQPYPPPHEKVP